MFGRNDDIIRKERNELKSYFTSMGYEIIDSYIEDQAPDSVHQGAWYLGKSIQLLSSADITFFMDGWQNARGCKIERLVSHEYGIPIIHD